MGRSVRVSDLSRASGRPASRRSSDRYRRPAAFVRVLCWLSLAIVVDFPDNQPAANRISLRRRAIPVVTDLYLLEPDGSHRIVRAVFLPALARFTGAIPGTRELRLVRLRCAGRR